MKSFFDLLGNRSMFKLFYGSQETSAFDIALENKFAKHPVQWVVEEGPKIVQQLPPRFLLL